MRWPRRSLALHGKRDDVNETDIERLIAAQDSLIAALDAGDIAAVEVATAAMSRLLAMMRSHCTVGRVERARVDCALKQTEAARTRVNYLADRTRQKLDRMAERRGNQRPPTYTAAGRFAIFRG